MKNPLNEIWTDIDKSDSTGGLFSVIQSCFLHKSFLFTFGSAIFPAERVYCWLGISSLQAKPSLSRLASLLCCFILLYVQAPLTAWALLQIEMFCRCTLCVVITNFVTHTSSQHVWSADLCILYIACTFSLKYQMNCQSRIIIHFA